MIDPQIKKKIINTISKYEEKCTHLQNEITTLRATIEQLHSGPQKAQEEISKHLETLRRELNESEDTAQIKNHLLMISETITGIQQKDHEQQRHTHHLIAQACEILKSVDQSNIFSNSLLKLEKLIAEKVNDKLLSNQFLSLLRQTLDFWTQSFNVNTENASNLELDIPKDKPAGFLASGVNDSLRELLVALCFPESMELKKNKVLEILGKPLSEKRLVDIIDYFVELVIMAFNLEQNRLKDFLQQLSLQMEEFNHYLGFSVSSHHQVHEDTMALETDIWSQIELVERDLGGDINVKELTELVQQGFMIIKNKVRDFRDKEQCRISEYEEQISQLKERLAQTQLQTQELSEILSYREQHMNQDSLTGLPNRAAYDDHLLNVWHRWQRGFGDLSLALADLDHFKQINDRYGHLAGDKVLKKVSFLFKSSIRAVDFVARYGGEEFAFIFERTDKEKAMTVLNHIQQQLADTEFHYRETPVMVTTSFGVTDLKENDTLESFFERADKALYEAKKAGRNQIIML